MQVRFTLALVLISASVGLVGCGGNSTSEPETLTPVNFDNTKYLLTEEPDGAVGVIEAKETAEDGALLVVVGRIGGSEKPWVEGRAAFTLIDPSMTVVESGTDANEDEICTDDCCANERVACTTLVKIVDEKGQVVPVDSRKLLGLQLDDMVVIRGTAKKDQEGNFTLLASGLYVRK